ncbi:MAG: ankyrin repeat domain-containing protein [Candidatus Omnitrophica bacterium]|nr:ankyrin repeat domain-containing protein [Candidatus Omnitrophota bacterium]
MLKRLIASLVCFSFIISNLQYVHAQDFGINQLPVPGTMVGESAPFTPLALKGLIVNPQKPLEFQFIVDTGSDSSVIAREAKQSQQEQLKQQANQLVKYFLAGLTIPEGDLWVNLSPYEKERIVPEALGQTDLGRDLLAQDYILKQLTASLIYPEKDLGKEFWSRVYAKVQEQFGTTDVPVNTFNKVWILPDQAQVYENGNTAYVTQSTLKVMLDEDYTALNRHFEGVQSTTEESKGASRSFANAQDDKAHALASQIVREIILPEIEKEVNTGRNFSPLRQIYQALILAKWYKETIQNGLLDAVYTNKKKVAGVNLDDPAIKEQIYQRYLKAYKKGVFNYIKDEPIGASLRGGAADEVISTGTTIPRKYFSGGIPMQINLKRTKDPSMLSKILTAATSVFLLFTVSCTEINTQPNENTPIKPVTPPQSYTPQRQPYVPQKQNPTFTPPVPTPPRIYNPPPARPRDHSMLNTIDGKGKDSAMLNQMLSKKDNSMESNLQKAWAAAAWNGDIEGINKMLAQRIDIDMKVEDVTALMFAAMAGRKDIVELLIRKKAAVNAKTKDGWTALMGAALAGRDDVVELLLANGADAKAETNLGETALFMAAKNNYINVMRQLINKGADVNAKTRAGETVLRGAAFIMGWADNIMLLLENGADIDTKSQYAVTALFMAAQKGNWKVAERLLVRGVSPDARMGDDEGTVLMMAAGAGHKEVVDLLLKRGAKVDARDRDEWTALMYASLGGHLDIVELLLNNGANVNAKDNIGGTPLSIARNEGNDVIVRKLIASGAIDNAMMNTPKAVSKTKQSVVNGGIDLNQISIKRNGKIINVQFDPAQLNKLMQGGFQGFSPVIINVTPIQNPLPLLGIGPAKEEASLTGV